MSQPPYGPPPPDPGLPAPVDPYQSPGQPGYSLYPETPGYGQGYPETQPYPVSGYPGEGYQQTPTYQAPGYPGGQPAQPYPPYQQQPPQPLQYPGGPQYPGYPGYPAPQPSGGGGKTLVVVLVVVLLVVVIGGGIGAVLWFGSHHTGTTSANGSTGPSATPSAAASATPTSGGATHSGDLRTYLVASPSGSRPWSKPLGTDRKLSIDEAAALSSDSTARKQMLTKYNYTQGAVQCWVASDATQVDVRLYQFDSTDDATGFYNDDVDATSGGYDAAQVNPIAGVQDGKSFGDPKKDDQGYTQALSIGVNGDVVIVVDVREKGDLDITVPNGIFSQQYGKL